MLKTKKTFYFVLCAILAASLFVSGCRTKESDGPKEDYSGIELTYYKVFDDSDAIEPLIDQYIADHPGLKINYRKFSDFDEYQKLILNEMAEGEGPDIFSMQNTWFASNFRKLAPMPKEYGSVNDFAETFVNVAYDDLVRIDDTGEERVFGLPMTVDTLALYYNKAHFEDRIPTKGRPSTTWEGIKDDVTKLNKTDNSLSRFEVAGAALGRADNISRAVDILYLMMLQYGTEFYNQNISQAIFAGKQGDGGVNYPAQEALQLYTSFANEDQKNYSWNEYVVDDDSEAREVAAFASGDVSMIIGYSYTYDEIMNQIDLLASKGVKTIDKGDVRVAEIPQLYDPDISKEARVTYASYFAEAVSKNSEHPDIAWDFLIFMTSREILDQYFEELHKPTSRRDMIEEQRKHPIYGVFADQIGFAKSFPILDYYRYKDIFSNVIYKANTDVVTRGDVVDAQDLINEMLPDEGLVPELDSIEEDQDK